MFCLSILTSDQSNIGVEFGVGLSVFWTNDSVCENLCEYSAVSEWEFTLNHFQLKDFVCFGCSFTKQRHSGGLEIQTFENKMLSF